MADKPMRQQMPETAAFVDAVRAKGLTDNATLAQGLKDGTFWAKEGGQVIGKPATHLVAVRPVLPLGMEVKHLDREWESLQVKGQGQSAAKNRKGGKAA